MQQISLHLDDSIQHNTGDLFNRHVVITCCNSDIFFYLPLRIGREFKFAQRYTSFPAPLPLICISSYLQEANLRQVSAVEQCAANDFESFFFDLWIFEKVSWCKKS